MQKEGSNNGVLPFDEGAGSMFCSTSYVGDARSPEWLASGLTEDSATSNINGDDVMFGRHKPRKSNRIVNGGDGGEDITRTRIHTRQNDQEAELDASMPVSYSSNIDVNGKFTSIWDLVATGRIIKVNRSITGLRRGKWYAEEEAYVNRLILEFKKGLLPLKNGTTLRSFLSRLLNCDPMRISKKFVGDNCVGKQTYKRKNTDGEDSDDSCTEVILMELAKLELSFLQRISRANNLAVKAPLLPETMQDFEVIDKQQTDIHKPSPSTGGLYDSSPSEGGRLMEQSPLSSPKFIKLVSSSGVNDTVSEGSPCNKRKSSPNESRQYTDGLLSPLDMREDETGQSGYIEPIIGSPPVTTKEDWSHKSSDSDGYEIAFKFVKERYEPDSTMKEFFISAHDTHMVPIESAQMEGTTETAQ